MTCARFKREGRDCKGKCKYETAEKTERCMGADPYVTAELDADDPNLQVGCTN
jgi:hypothetical protein